MAWTSKIIFVRSWYNIGSLIGRRSLFLSRDAQTVHSNVLMKTTAVHLHLRLSPRQAKLFQSLANVVPGYYRNVAC
jgi:hypothetical protein